VTATDRPDLKALEATLLRACAVARLGALAPPSERRAAAAVLALLDATTTRTGRQVLLWRCTPSPPRGDFTPWQRIADESGLDVADLERIHRRALQEVAAALDREAPTG
jgi:hypothetical protein